MSTSDKSSDRSGRAAFTAAFLAAGLYFLAFHLSKWWPVAGNMDLKYDAMLRLELVRNLLSDGTWYDNTLQDVLPPDGFGSHWSRYVDAPLAGLVWLLSQAFPTKQAEIAAVTLWPILVYLGILWALGRFALLVFGLPIACLTLLGLSLSPLHFMQWLQLGNIDHHGLQLFLAAVCLPLLGAPHPTPGKAALAGLASALVFTVSLDSIFFIAMMATFTGLAWAFKHADARFLSAFLAAFGSGVWVLFLVENPPDAWTTLQCDAVSGPYLILALGACGTALACRWAAHRATGPASRLTVFGLSGLLAIAAALPFYAPCASGPYAMVSPVTHAFVLESHPEVIGLLAVLLEAPVAGLQTAMPILSGAGVLAWCLWRPAPGHSSAQYWATVLLLLMMLAGVLGALYQMRTSIYAYAPLPVAVALFLHRLWTAPALRNTPLRAPLVALATPTLFLTPLVFIFAVQTLGLRVAWPYPSPVAEATFPEACISSVALKHLDVLPRGVVLSPIDYGARVLAHTHHATANLNSHRSPEGMDNALLPFLDDGSALLDLLDRRHIDYIVLCRGMQFTDGDNIGTRMAAGIAPDGFAAVDLTEARRLVVYRARP